MSTPLDEPLTEKRVAKLLMRDRFAKHVVLPSYTPAGWWENDVFMISESGYWHEFEIKLTLADFRRDAEKSMADRKTGRWEKDPATGRDHWVQDHENKHDLLAKSDRGPCSFWYVAPLGVIPVSALPAWAGLIEIEVNGKYAYERAPTVKAPRRHGSKIDEKIKRAVFETCYWRYHRAGH